MKDLYYILGQDINATPHELNAAYRKLAKKLRPDGAEYDPFLESHFCEIAAAYQVLSDPDKRRRYDAALRKNHKRRLYWFQLSYLSVAAVLTLIGFTALFGFYVIKMIAGSKAKPVAPIITAEKAVIPVKHHKKKHKALSGLVIIHKAIKPEIIGKQAPVKKDTMLTRVIKPAYVATVIKPPAAAKPPVVINTPAYVNNVAPTNTAVKTYLQANATGVVSLHQLASYQSAIITYIPNHSEVQVLEKGPSFCKVTFHDQTGYVPKWTIPE